MSCRFACLILPPSARDVVFEDKNSFWQSLGFEEIWLQKPLAY